MSAALATRVGERLTAAGLTLAVAESCTGGLLSARLTDRAGASAYFLGGLTTYADEAKIRVLAVPGAALAAHGAVSETVARAMAEGARRAVGADAAVAVTGVAGPGGGTADKPVGTVWIAASMGETMHARRFSFDGDRAAIRDAAVAAALEVLDRLLDATPEMDA